jgi:predicted dinucleotide-binding enzyme
MRIGIIGAGAIGGTLARRLVKRGQVSIANSRGPESLAALAAEIGATPVSVVDAANTGEIVIISIPTKSVADLPRDLFANVPSSVVVINTGNYHPELRDGRIDAIDRGMLDSQWVAHRLGRPVIKAFNNILAKSLLEKGVPRGTTGRIALSVAGDSFDAKATVLRLVDDLGLDPVDGGDLDNSWRQQPGTPAYCRDLEAGALRRALANADRSRIAEYRAEREAHIRRDIASRHDESSAKPLCGCRGATAGPGISRRMASERASQHGRLARRASHRGRRRRGRAASDRANSRARMSLVNQRPQRAQ